MDQKLEDTFLKALEQNQQKLLRICSVYAEDADDKKDLFQEALINIWQAMPSFEEKSSLSTWMFRITLNVCLRLQSRQVKKRDRFLKMDSVRIENMATEETRGEDHERLVKLRTCIKKLNHADRAVITLYLEELPYKEISEITGLTENHVAVMIKRTKEKLLNCIIERS
ncbi:MAG TPA: sigma-70 family RNA polymerase sigma factor [Chryseolinea sp.]